MLAKKPRERHYLATALTEERRKLELLVQQTSPSPPIKEALERWESAAWEVESEARQQRADGCRYMTHTAMLRSALGLAAGAAGAVLETVAEAATALVQWGGQSEGDGGAGLTPEQRKAAFGQLQPAVRKAYLAFQYAETMRGRRLEDREAHDWLKEDGIDQDKLSAGELADYEVPTTFDTFRRYVTEARQALGESKHTRRAGRPTGRSIASGREIERQRGDDD